MTNQLINLQLTNQLASNYTYNFLNKPTSQLADKLPTCKSTS